MGTHGNIIITMKKLMFTIITAFLQTSTCLYVIFCPICNLPVQLVNILQVIMSFMHAYFEFYTNTLQRGISLNNKYLQVAWIPVNIPN